MAIRAIREEGDPVLNKVCKEVKEVTPKIKELIEDMIETMQEANGVGLAAPQVGILRRICVVDVGEEFGTPEPVVLINPEITQTEGEQFGQEGCLSLPGYVGDVRRPMKVVVKGHDIDLKEFEITGEGLLARALCHEIDHLSGHLYTELVEGGLRQVNQEETEEEQ